MIIIVEFFWLPRSSVLTDKKQTGSTWTNTHNTVTTTRRATTPLHYCEGSNLHHDCPVFQRIHWLFYANFGFFGEALGVFS
jgi:hypothetical protein